MILDIISLVIILVFVIIGIVNGGAKVIFRLLSVVASFVLSLFLADFLAKFVYNTFIKQTILNNINSVLTDSALTTASDKAASFFSSIPVAFVNTLRYFGFSQASVISAFDTADAANRIENMMMTPVVGVISIIFFLILFGVLGFLLGKIFKHFAKIFRLPIIRVVDSIIGFVFGLAEGLLVLFLLSLIIKLLIPLTGGDLMFMNEAYIAESSLFSFVYFGRLSSFVQLLVFSFT